MALHRLLSSGRDASDPNALLNFFFLEDTHDGQTGDAPRPKRRQKKQLIITVPTPPDLPAPKRRIRIEHSAGGFRIIGTPRLRDISLPAQLRVDVAYDVERGNAFKDWETHDFDFSARNTITIRAVGATYTASGNRIEVEIEDAAFELQASGFDQQRDLVVQTAWRRGTADA